MSGSSQQKSVTKTRILAGDVGATKTNLALIDVSRNRVDVVQEAAYKTSEFSSCEKMIQQFLPGISKPEKICLGVAGPVTMGKVSMTNTGWLLDERRLSASLNLPVTLLNDLEATAHALPIVPADDLHIIHAGKPSKANKAVIAPGTGLGEAGVYWDGEHHRPFATEGGHCAFAPTTSLDVQLLCYLQEQFEHVSWERVVSGPGLVAIYNFLVLNKNFDEPVWLKEKMLSQNKAAIITENVLTADLCNQTVELFLRYLATEAACLALKHNAGGGIYIAGGIMPRLIKVLNNNLFHKWFCNAGRLKAFLEDIPITLLCNPKLPVLGAALFGAGVAKR